MPDVSGKNHIFEIVSTSDRNIDGQLKIRERNDGSTQAELVLSNLDTDTAYPAFIHFNNALEGGGIAITLTPVDGQSQTSVTEIRTLNSGVTLTYEELRNFDGHITIQEGTNPGTMVAQADIGMNALTGRFQQFSLQEEDIPDATGLLTIEERESGFSLITVTVEGGTEGKQHPVTLNFGSLYDNHELAGNLNPVDGTDGIGRTHLEQLNGELIAPYLSLVEFQGFVRVHLGTGAEMNTILAQGNIAYVEN